MNNWYNPYDSGIQWGDGISNFLRNNRDAILKIIGMGGGAPRASMAGEGNPAMNTPEGAEGFGGIGGEGESVADLFKTGGVSFAGAPLPSTPTGGFTVGGGGGEVDMSGLTGSPADYYLGSMPGSEKRRPGAVVGGGGAPAPAKPSPAATPAASAGAGGGIDMRAEMEKMAALMEMMKAMGASGMNPGSTTPNWPKGGTTSLRGQYASGGEFMPNSAPASTRNASGAKSRGPQGGGQGYGIGSRGAISNANPALGNQSPLGNPGQMGGPEVMASPDQQRWMSGFLGRIPYLGTDVSSQQGHPGPGQMGGPEVSLSPDLQKILAMLVSVLQKEKGPNYSVPAPGLRER